MKKAVTKLVRILLVLATCVQIAASAELPDNQGDPVLHAMVAELHRSMSELKLPDIAGPYYIEYRIVDLDQYNAETSFGALRTDIRTHLRFLRVVVRVGSYKQDSFFAQGQGTIGLLPLGDDEDSLRQQIWLATDDAYKAATEALAEKQAQLKQFSIEHPVDDFSRADPIVSIGPLTRLDFDPAPFLKMLRDGPRNLGKTRR